MHNFIIGPTDTDSISLCKPDGAEFSIDEIKGLVKELNEISPEFMVFENDGYYPKCVTIRAKNYILFDGKKKIIKGSALKDGKKEPALREFMQECVDCFLNDKQDQILRIYQKYVAEAINIKDINRWCVKKTITKPVLTNERTNEKKIRDAVEGQDVSEGDKVYVYSAIDGEVQKVVKGESLVYANGSPVMVPNTILRTPEKWSGNEDKFHYVERVHDCLSIFEFLIDLTQYPKYHLKKNRKDLTNLPQYGTL